MILQLRLLIVVASQILIASAAPVGICLHAYSPEAPVDKIECFEFEKFERVGSDYRLFLPTGRSVMVTAYRFRGMIPYKPELKPNAPEFANLLKTYEGTARTTPATRAYLNPRILAMRSETLALQNQTLALQNQADELAKKLESAPKLPSMTLTNGSKITDYKMTSIKDGLVSIMHQAGVINVKLKELDSSQKIALNSTTEKWSLEEPSATPKDSEGTFAKIVFKNGIMLKKAQFKEVSDGKLVFVSDEKRTSIPVDQFPCELSVLGEEVTNLLAASQGDIEAQYNLGLCYANGDGVSKDVAEAVKWYRKAAEQGNFKAQSSLGFCYANGDGVSKDFTEALKWHVHSGEGDYNGSLDFNKAHYRFNFLCANGGSIPKDSDKAVMWYRKAADQGDAQAQSNLGFCYANGYAVQKDMTEAGKWFRKAGDQGDPVAQFNLGQLYSHGDGVPKDMTEAMRWYGKAAELGNADAQGELGNGYRFGLGVPQDHAEARKWYRKGAEQGNADLQFRLGNIYARGLGVPMNNTEGFKWILKAAEQGHVLAQHTLGRSYVGALMGSLNIGRDDIESAKWMRMASERGYAEAQHSLSLIYAYGVGVSEDKVMAYKWCMLAAGRGSEKAKEFKARLEPKLTVEQIAKAQKLTRDFKPLLGGDRK